MASGGETAVGRSSENTRGSSEEVGGAALVSPNTESIMYHMYNMYMCTCVHVYYCAFYLTGVRYGRSRVYISYVSCVRTRAIVSTVIFS